MHHRFRRFTQIKLILPTIDPRPEELSEIVSSKIQNQSLKFGIPEQVREGLGMNVPKLKAINMSGNKFRLRTF